MGRFYIVFLILIFSATGLVYALQSGWYPLALVNAQLVWQWQFEQEYSSAQQYYNQAIETYEIPDLTEEKIKELKEDLERATLDKIIEKLIVAEGFNAFTGDDGGQLVLDKVDKYLENPKLEAAAVSLFNLEFPDFVDLILIPQAEKEILQEKLNEESRDFDNWLKNKKNQAKVHLFSSTFHWTGEAIERQ
ncbi:MAG: hypothetical protein ABH822_01150 [Patescibacteria group bacterium]